MIIQCLNYGFGIIVQYVRSLIQNAAARLVFNQPKFSHVTPLLRSLHWLPVVARAEFKTLLLAFKATKGMTPPYLTSLIAPYKPSHAFRSADAGKLVVHSLKTPGQRSTRPKLFSLLAPKLWNALPTATRTADSLHCILGLMPTVSRSMD